MKKSSYRFPKTSYYKGEYHKPTYIREESIKIIDCIDCSPEMEKEAIIRIINNCLLMMQKRERDRNKNINRLGVKNYYEAINKYKLIVDTISDLTFSEIYEDSKYILHEPNYDKLLFISEHQRDRYMINYRRLLFCDFLITHPYRVWDLTRYSNAVKERMKIEKNEEDALFSNEIMNYKYITSFKSEIEAIEYINYNKLTLPKKIRDQYTHMISFYTDIINKY